MVRGADGGNDLTIMEDFFRRARAHRLHSLSDRRTREEARHLAENGDASGASDLLDIAELALHPALAAAGGGRSPVVLTSKTLTAAEILDLNNTPITLIPAPTGRRYIWPLHMVFHGRPGATPFSGGDSPVLTVGWTTDYSVAVDSSNLAIVQGASDLYQGMTLSTLATNRWEAGVVEATPLLLYGVGIDAVFPSTDWLTAGNGSLTVRTWYSIIDGAPPS
jgi:hypothetical protein